MKLVFYAFVFAFAFDAFAAPRPPESKRPSLGAEALPKSQALKKAPNISSRLCPIQIVPGQSIGPLKLGMGRQELEQLHWPTRLPAQESGYVSRAESEFTRGSVGPFHVVLENDRLTHIQADLNALPECLRIKNVSLKGNTRTLQELASKLKQCDSGQVGVKCKDGLSFVSTRNGLRMELEAPRQ